MAVSKKGARKIRIGQVDYLYKVSKIKGKSDWREQRNELDDTFMKYAACYGLGQVQDSTIDIVIQLYDNPISSMFIRIHTILVDGFLGPEQIIKIKPNFIAQLITTTLDGKWNPYEKGDYRLTIAEKQSKEEKPIEIKINRQGGA
jgi:hypothetical protein